MIKRRFPTMIESYDFSSYVLRRILMGITVNEVVSEINQLAVDKQYEIIFTRHMVANFLSRCNLAHQIYYQDLARKTIEPIVDILQEAAKSVTRLVRAAEVADEHGNLKDLVSASKELHGGLRLLAELQKKLDTRPITVTQVNAIVLDVADAVEKEESIPLHHRKQILRLFAEALPRVGQLAGMTNAGKQL